MSTRRELAPEEVAEIAALAAEFPDLRRIRPLIADLQERNGELAALQVDAVMIRPRNVEDLIKLLQAKVVSAEWVKQRLPGGGEAVATTAADTTFAIDPINEKPYAVAGALGYIVHDKRVEA